MNNDEKITINIQIICKMRKKIVFGTMALLILGCRAATSQESQQKSKSIVILYENDAHCGIDGYTKIAGLRDAINQHQPV